MLETMSNGSPVEVSDLDAEWLLDFAADAEVRERQAERRQPAGRRAVVCAAPGHRRVGVCDLVRHRPARPVPGRGSGLGGEGTPLVAAFTPEPFAAALGVSTRPGCSCWPTPWTSNTGSRASGRPSKPGGGAVEGPQDRPGHPPSLPSRRRVGRRPARGPDRLVWVAGDRDRGRPGHRHLRPAPAGDPGEAGPGRLGGAAVSTAGSAPTVPTTGSAPPIWRSPATPWT